MTKEQTPKDANEATIEAVASTARLGAYPLHAKARTAIAQTDGRIRGSASKSMTTHSTEFLGCALSRCGRMDAPLAPAIAKPTASGRKAQVSGTTQQARNSDLMANTPDMYRVWRAPRTAALKPPTPIERRVA